MTRKLDLKDFRAVRRVLEPDDFAVSDGGPEPAPTDLISEDAWHGIMLLPDDVAIRTTSHQGSRIALLYALWSNWIEMLPTKGILLDGMLDGGDDLAAALFDLTHGYYKQAVASLRNFLEVMVFACDCHISNNERKWLAWRNGKELRFTDIAKKLGKRIDIKTKEERAFSETGTCIFPSTTKERKNKDWLGNLYGRFCKFAHASGDGGNGHLWASNGPVYSAEGMRISYLGYLEAFALASLITKLAWPELTLGSECPVLFEPVSIAQYAHKPFNELCRNYAAVLRV